MGHQHNFKKGDVVTIFQMTGSGLFIEGDALIVKAIPKMEDRFQVRFYRRNGKLENETVERFVDYEGQSDPPKYVREFNKRIGVAA